MSPPSRVPRADATRASDEPYTVHLAHAPNPDLFDRGGCWDRGAPSVGESRVGVPTLEAASATVRDYIETHRLGGGNWTGGDVHDRAGTRVAHISYNGRIWPVDAQGKLPAPW